MLIVPQLRNPVVDHAPGKGSDPSIPYPKTPPTSLATLASPGKVHPLFNNLLWREASADYADKVRLSGERRSGLAADLHLGHQMLTTSGLLK